MAKISLFVELDLLLIILVNEETDLLKPDLEFFAKYRYSDPENWNNPTSKSEIESNLLFLFLLRELNNETEESSVNDESGEANEETIAKPSAVLKRRRTKSIMPSTKSKAVKMVHAHIQR